MRRCLVLAAALAATAPGIAAAAGPGGIRVILLGDSTLAPRNGYGDALCARFTPQVACLNLAKNGRSSGSYRAEGSWNPVAALLAGNAAFSATYVLVEFGHNDQPGKPGRSTDLKTEFPANLARYVDEIRASGATPVLVTPLSRRNFQGAVLVDDLAPWAAAARAVAVAQGAVLIDLHAASTAAVQAMGAAEADTLAVEPPTDRAASAAGDRAATETTSAARSAFDHTHVGAKGAQLFARMVEGLLRRGVPALVPCFKPDSE
jgi:lysophospholipase L1-like esterase